MITYVNHHVFRLSFLEMIHVTAIHWTQPKTANRSTGKSLKIKRDNVTMQNKKQFIIFSFEASSSAILYSENGKLLT